MDIVFVHTCHMLRPVKYQEDIKKIVKNGNFENGFLCKEEYSKMIIKDGSALASAQKKWKQKYNEDYLPNKIKQVKVSSSKKPFWIRHFYIYSASRSSLSSFENPFCFGEQDLVQNADWLNKFSQYFPDHIDTYGYYLNIGTGKKNQFLIEFFFLL